MTPQARREQIRGRMRLLQAIREGMTGLGYEEVETPILVPAPGLEPAITAFRTSFEPEMGPVDARPLWLHTSPEYAMKRMIADGWERIFQLCRVFRNGEVGPFHNPEFTMLEFYRTPGDYRTIMADLERLVLHCAAALGCGDRIVRDGIVVSLRQPFERLTVREAFLRETGLDIAELVEAEDLRRAAVDAGFAISPETQSWDDVFFSIFLSSVEPRLGHQRPTFLVDYPLRMAALSRAKRDDPTVAERFELYVAGLELANGFTELDDASEQRRRLLAEQEERLAAGREVYPLDERFLEAVGRLPPCGGVAVGVERLAMLFTGAESITEVLTFPAETEWGRG